MSLIDIRKRCLIVETTFHEYGPPPAVLLKLAASCAVIRNPYAGRYEPDLMPFMAELRGLGTLLATELVDTLGKDSIEVTARPPSSGWTARWSTARSGTRPAAGPCAACWASPRRWCRP